MEAFKNVTIAYHRGHHKKLHTLSPPWAAQSALNITMASKHTVKLMNILKILVCFVRTYLASGVTSTLAMPLVDQKIFIFKEGLVWVERIQGFHSFVWATTTVHVHCRCQILVWRLLCPPAPLPGHAPHRWGDTLSSHVPQWPASLLMLNDRLLLQNYFATQRRYLRPSSTIR